MKDLITFLAVFGVAISLILIFLLFKEKKRELDKNILIVIFSFIFFTCVSVYSDLHGLEKLLYISALFDGILFWVLGPLMFLYVKSIFFDNKNLVLKNIYHFLPSIFLPLFDLLFFMFEADAEYLKFIKSYQLLVLFIRDMYFSIYIIFSIKLFLKLKKTLNKKLNISLEGYNWILKLLIGILVFPSIDILMRTLELFGFHLELYSGQLTFVAIIIFLTYFGYYSINEARFLIPSFLIEDDKKTNYVFSEDEASVIEQKIKEILENEKMFLDENLTLKKLSDNLQISEKKLSMFLNTHLNTKFADYINFYRVEAVKEKLKSEDYDKLTLLAISEECGFNSKASFYRIFKKHTGISPAQYKKKH
ncbi:AraC family transcriptional regulator [Winogradskyella wandonensis]|uniref:AraC family transcriptional regulator n=1 Tax=Winogradskyella wandonensis TaxID=1442586 RepID=A0A4R1KXV5_9FLAO|nr:AraC family transcriptional regulator [Winogradskyella wandonensis]TCK69400.1 AraC family transcriptional regulator [Winogradskyella wandonensis]